MPDMIKTILNCIDKKVEKDGYNNQYQKERPNDWNKQNYTKSYNNNNTNQYNSYRNNTNSKQIYKTRTTNRIDEYNEKLCKMYHDLKKNNC